MAASLSEGFNAEGFDSERDDRDGTSRRDRLKRIADLWSEIDNSDDTGATNRATLDEIEREVTDAMYGNMPDLDRAESLTFMALHYISGNI